MCFLWMLLLWLWCMFVSSWPSFDCCSLRVKGPAGANADLWAVRQSGFCLHLQKVQEVLFYSVRQTVRQERLDCLLMFQQIVKINSNKNHLAKIYLSCYGVNFLWSYNVGCTKRMGLFPNRKTTLENMKKQRALNGNHKNSSLESKKKVRRHLAFNF